MLFAAVNKSEPLWKRGTSEPLQEAKLSCLAFSRGMYVTHYHCRGGRCLFWTLHEEELQISLLNVRQINIKVKNVVTQAKKQWRVHVRCNGDQWFSVASETSGGTFIPTDGTWTRFTMIKTQHTIHLSCDRLCFSMFSRTFCQHFVINHMWFTMSFLREPILLIIFKQSSVFYNVFLEPFINIL